MFYYSPPQNEAKTLDNSLMVFFSHEDFSHNPLAFWEYVKENCKYKTLWIVKAEAIYYSLSDAGIACCQSNTEEMHNSLSIAKYVFMDGRQPIIWRVPKNQIIVQLSAAISFFYDVFTVSNYPKAYYDSLRSLKYMDAYSRISIASSPLTRIYTAASYGFDARKVCITGLPRNDAILNENGKDILFKEFPELKKYNKLILYTPSAKTMAQGGPSISSGYKDNIFNMDDFDQNEFEHFLEENSIAILFKMHPFDEYRIGVQNFPSKIPQHVYLFHTNSILGKTHYHIFNAFDCMISDTSSTSYEFLLLDRPIIFLHNELTMFKNYSPGCIIDDESIIYPGRRVYSFSDLLEALIESLSIPSNYSDYRRRTRELLHTYTDGMNCKRVLQLIESHDSEEQDINIEYEMYTHNLCEELNTILDSKSYRFSQRAVSILCPPNSLRRKLVKMVFRVLGVK